ncbi:MAG: sugar kinase, partial [Candidatus Omnitrophota bacterium]
MSILVLGTAALDTVRTPSGIRKKMLGGSAVHFAMSSRLFTKVHLVAVVGKDFPPEYVRFLERRGVILDSLLQAAGP